MRIQNIFSFLKEYRVFLLIGLFFASIFAFGLESAFAEDDPILSQKDSETLVNGLNMFITGAAALMGMVTSFITMFLYPGWVNGTLFGLQDYLKIMWILISNIVYTIFAFVLIAIAFMNIIGKGEGTWELKQAMPKFIVGVLIVPFSWFFVQFLLSLSAILTVGVLTLPYDSFQGNELFDKAMENQEFADKAICKDIIISFNGEWTELEGGEAATQQLGEDKNELDENIKCKSDEGTDGKVTIRELLTGKNKDGETSEKGEGLQDSIFGVMSIYTYGILQIDKLDTIDKASLQSVKSISDLIFKILFDVLFIAVYLLLMIALLLALFVRGVRLWLYVMLSPVFGLLYFFGKESEGVGDGNNKFSIKEFISLALVPVYVSAALAFGLVFILVASEGINETNEGSSTMQAGGFSLTIIGAHGDATDSGTGDKTYEKSIIAKLVVEIFGIVILWIAVMAALGSSETTKAIVEPIQAFGKSVGDLAAKAPTYAPIIPTGDGGMSIEALKTVSSSVNTSVGQSARKKGTDFLATTSLPGGGKGGNAQFSAKATDAVESIRQGESKDKQFSKLREALHEGKSTANLAGNNDFREAIKTLAESLSVTVGNLSDRGNMGKVLGEIEHIIDNDGSIQKELGGSLFEHEVKNKKELTANVIDNILDGGSDPKTPKTDTNTNNVTINPSNIANVTVDTTAGTADNISNLESELGGKTKITSTDKSVIEKALQDLKNPDRTPRFKDPEIEVLLNLLGK